MGKPGTDGTISGICLPSLVRSCQLVNNDSNHYKFTGKERDSESGLDYFGARYYSNGLGRFITPDWAAKATAVPYAEFSDPQSLNLYTYVRNIPTSKADLDGHDGGTGVLEIAEAVAEDTVIVIDATPFVAALIIESWSMHPVWASPTLTNVPRYNKRLRSERRRMVE